MSATMTRSPIFTVRAYGRCYEAVRVSEGDRGWTGTTKFTHSRDELHAMLDAHLDSLDVNAYLTFTPSVRRA